MVKINEVSELEVLREVGVLSLDSPPVNALSAGIREGILEGIGRAMGDEAVRAVVLICAGRTFIAGADIREFGKVPKGPGLREVEDAIENACKPVIAAIHGTALGGGLEVALCCHYRIATSTAYCGLPEVNLGLLPGAGGTQRLPRVVGVEKALEMVTSGMHVPADRCLEIGLLDEVIKDGDLRAAALDFAARILQEERGLRKIRDSEELLLPARGRSEIFSKFRSKIARKTRGFLAPEYNIRCIEAAVEEDFERGLEIEGELFRELLTDSQSRAQRHVFFAERQIWKLPGIPRDTPRIPIARVGVVGSGTMGGGIAMSFVNAGIPVHLMDTSREALERGLSVIQANYARSVSRGSLSTDEVEKRMALITGGLDLDALAESDLIIEAVFEDMDLKKEIFGKLDRIAKKGAILASNTSALDIDEIARSTARPEAVIGLHFFSPANVMRLIEVVRGADTAGEVIATSMDIAKKIGKNAVLVGVCPGFVGNRILAARQVQANQLVAEGVMPWDVDRVLFDFGLPMGPFAMSDLAGLDVGWRREMSQGESLRDQLCEMGRLGQKTGAGYYDYDENRRATPSSLVEGLIRKSASGQGGESREISDEEIEERCLYPMINEGMKILAEGMAIRASDIDIVWVNGYGWPAYRGGPMFYGEEVGFDLILFRLRELQEKFGAAFKPASLLEELVAGKKKLRDLGY